MKTTHNETTIIVIKTTHVKTVFYCFSVFMCDFALLKCQHDRLRK